MIIQPISVLASVSASTRARAIQRRLGASAQILSISNLSQVISAASRQVQPVPQCENGVCSVSWKPQRPVA